MRPVPYLPARAHGPDTSEVRAREWREWLETTCRHWGGAGRHISFGGAATWRYQHCISIASAFQRSCQVAMGAGLPIHRDVHLTDGEARAPRQRRWRGRQRGWRGVPGAWLRTPANRRELDAHVLALTAVEGVGNGEERARACLGSPAVSAPYLPTSANLPAFLCFVCPSVFVARGYVGLYKQSVRARDGSAGRHPEAAFPCYE